MAALPAPRVPANLWGLAQYAPTPMKPTSICLSLPLLAAGLVAQDHSRHTLVAPTGIFYDNVIQNGGGPTSNPNPSLQGLRWTYPASSFPWISEFVSTGNNGTFAWLGQNLNGQRVSFLHTADTVATPRWEVPVAGAQGLVVRAADKARACAVTAILAGPTHELRYFKGDSSTPLWTTTLSGVNAQSGLTHQISDDGRIVAVGYTNLSQFSEVQVFDALSATPTVPVRTISTTVAGPRKIDLSADGRRVLIGNHQSNLLYDTGSGVLVTSDFTTVSHDAHTVDGTGATWARGGFDVGVWKATTSGYQRILFFTDPTLTFGIYTACDLSADGSTFAVAATDASNNYLPFRVYCWKLTNTTATLAWTYSAAGAGQFQDTPTAVSVSDDGKYIAVGSWGAQNNSHPEAMLFDRDAGNTPIGTVDTPGSVFDLDLSGDGQFMVVGTKSVHANTFGNGGEGYSFDRGGQAHRLRGAAAPGSTITLETGGNAGEPVILILGSGLGAPISIPGLLGTLRIDLSLPYVALGVGAVPGTGVFSLPLTIPNVPSAIGVTNYTQTARLGAIPEIENVIQISITQ